MAGVIPNVFVEVELSGSGGGWTSLGNDVILADGVTIRRGIDGGGPDDNVASTGTASFLVNNSERNSASTLGYYSPYHASKRSGWALDIGCRIRVQDPATSTIYTRFVGRIDSIDPLPGINNERSVAVTAVDWMDDAARWSLTADVAEQVGQPWENILADILAEMPTQPTATSFEMGVEAYPYALDSSAFSAQAALSEFKKLADSERGLIYIKADGTLKAEGRHSRLLNTTSVQTLTDIGDVTLPSTRDEVIDTVRVTIHPRIVDPLPTSVVYNQANTIPIDAGVTKLLLGSYRDEITGDTIGATDIQALTSGSDYVANSVEDGSGSDVSSDLSIAVSIGPSGASFSVTNGGAATAYLITLQLRGKAIKDQATLQLQSPTVTGQHVVALDMPYQDSADVGQGAADYYVAKYGTAFAQARTVSVDAKTAALLTALLQREISHRITIQETVTGLNNDFFINGLEERVMPSGHMQASYTLAPAADPFAGLYWIVDSSTLGTNTIPAPF